MSENIIVIKNMNFKYPDGTIGLNNVSIQIKKAKKIAVLGENGAGKSTFFFMFERSVETR